MALRTVLIFYYPCHRTADKHALKVWILKYFRNICVLKSTCISVPVLPWSRATLILLSSLFSELYSYWIMQGSRLCWILLIASISRKWKLVLVTLAFLAYDGSELYLWMCFFFFACLLKWAKAKRIIFLECFLIHDGFPVSLPQVYPFSCKITSASTQGFQRLFFLQTSFVTFSKQSHGICPIKISKMEKKTQNQTPKLITRLRCGTIYKIILVAVLGKYHCFSLLPTPPLNWRLIACFKLYLSLAILMWYS